MYDEKTFRAFDLGILSLNFGTLGTMFIIYKVKLDTLLANAYSTVEYLDMLEYFFFQG